VIDLALIGNTLLRNAIQRNLVSFPAQIPAFMKSSDVQERIVQLYFVRGWQMKSICERYRLDKSTVRKLLTDWKSRAVAAGYIQHIHPEPLAALARQEEVSWHEAIERSTVESSIKTPEPAWDTALAPRPAHIGSRTRQQVTVANRPGFTAQPRSRRARQS
jgi:hypothetical protein